jgi:hypothetical protein
VSSNNRTNEVTDASVSGHTGFGKSSDSQWGSLENIVGLSLLVSQFLHKRSGFIQINRLPDRGRSIP